MQPTYRNIIFNSLLVICLLLTPLFSNNASASESKEPLAFDDTPLKKLLTRPDWFKLSFLDLKESLNEANSHNRGLIIYFERKNCAYCKAQLEINWGSADIVQYTKEHFDVIAINVRGQQTVTDFDGSTYTESEYAVKMQTDFTPSFLFFDGNGNAALRLYGYRPPYQFRAALEYAIDQHYKTESFRHYLARAENAMSFGQEELNENDVFRNINGTVDLNRSNKPANKALAVFLNTPDVTPAMSYTQAP